MTMCRSRIIPAASSNAALTFSSGAWPAEIAAETICSTISAVFRRPRSVKSNRLAHIANGGLYPVNQAAPLRVAKAVNLTGSTNDLDDEISSSVHSLDLVPRNAFGGGRDSCNCESASSHVASSSGTFSLPASRASIQDSSHCKAEAMLIGVHRIWRRHSLKRSGVIGAYLRMREEYVKEVGRSNVHRSRLFPYFSARNLVGYLFDLWTAAGAQVDRPLSASRFMARS